MKLGILVRKADGREQLFDRAKVARTCMALGATEEIADEIARRVETQIYSGMETRKILRLIYRMMSEYKPGFKNLICLRESLSLLDPKPDFEWFIQTLLGEHGYDVTKNRIIRGRCVDHEVDAVAKRNGVRYIVEVKHHFNFHTYTGLDESRIAWAILEDVKEGFELGLNSLKIDKAMLVCNTKFSEHAKRYGKCKDIYQIGWSWPPERGLQRLIEEKKLYPITCLKGLKANVRKRLGNSGIILLKQLVEKSTEELRRATKIPKQTLGSTIMNARTILSERQ